MVIERFIGLGLLLGMFLSLFVIVELGQLNTQLRKIKFNLWQLEDRLRKLTRNEDS